MLAAKVGDMLAARPSKARAIEASFSFAHQKITNTIIITSISITLHNDNNYYYYDEDALITMPVI